MLNSHDKQFESYLKHFRPVTPMALPRIKQGRHRSIGALALWGSMAAATAILTIGFAVWNTHMPYRGVHRQIFDPVSLDSKAPLPPLTVGSANRWIGAAPSFDTALDDLAFRAKNAPIPANKKSALAVLREGSNTL